MILNVLEILELYRPGVQRNQDNYHAHERKVSGTGHRGSPPLIINDFSQTSSKWLEVSQFQNVPIFSSVFEWLLYLPGLGDGDSVLERLVYLSKGFSSFLNGFFIVKGAGVSKSNF